MEGFPQSGPIENNELGEVKPLVKGIESEEEVLTPELAMQKLFLEMDELETGGRDNFDKKIFIERVVDLLRLASKTEDPQAYKIFRDDEHFKKLKIGNRYLIQNSFDRDLHQKVLSYLESLGIETTDGERQEIIDFFKSQNVKKKKEIMESYSQNGLLTLKSAMEKGVLKETSATPGDFSSSEGLGELTDNESGNVRGYEMTTEDIDSSIFYGRNGFFGVVLERGGEAIDRSTQMPKIEIENRLRNSIIFVVKSNKLQISKRAENIKKEDIVGRDLKPKEIDYLLVDKTNLSLAQEVFGRLPTKIIGVDSVEVALEGLFDGPYTLPDYKGQIDQIVRADGPIWCHIARLPTETYPK